MATTGRVTGTEIEMQHHQIVDIGQRGARGELQCDKHQERRDAETDAAFDVTRG